MAIARLIEELDDPFFMLPLATVSDSLLAEFELHQESYWHAENGMHFRSVEQEHYHDASGLILGAVFVLGQTAITQTVSILNELESSETFSGRMPRRRSRLMKSLSPSFEGLYTFGH